MKITQTTLKIKCDSIYCHNNAKFCLSLNSYKGDIYQCLNCFNKLKNAFKKDILKNDKKEL